MTDIPMEPGGPDEPLGEPPPEPTPALTTIVDRLGVRAERRMAPRMGVALAGAGALVAIGGAIGIAGDQLVEDDGDLQRLPGIAIASLVIVAGFAVLTRFRGLSAPLAAAGTTAAALGVPVLLFFLTVDEGDFPPVSVDAVLLVSAMAWFVAFAVGPGAGRLFFLGLALVASWLFVLNLLEPVENLTPFGALRGTTTYESNSSFGYELDEDGNVVTDDSFGFDEDGSFYFPDEDLDGTPDVPDFDDDLVAPSPTLPSPFGFRAPDLTDVGIVSLLFGVGYAAAGLVASRRGRHGLGTPFAVASLAALGLGISVLAPDLEQTGTGLVLVAVGLGLAAAGAASSRRLTTWIGAGGVGIGALVLVDQVVDDRSTTSRSAVFLLLGVAIVIVAHLLSRAVDEPDEELDGPSFSAPSVDDAPVVE